jgi:putative addiction module component (TIGR02574 family)
LEVDMSDAAKKIEAEALELPVQARAHLAHRLLESLDEEAVEDPSEVTRAWEAEIERRVQEYHAGRAETIPASEVFAEARSRLERR